MLGGSQGASPFRGSRSAAFGLSRHHLPSGSVPVIAYSDLSHDSPPSYLPGHLLPCARQQAYCTRSVTRTQHSNAPLGYPALARAALRVITHRSPVWPPLSEPFLMEDRLHGQADTPLLLEQCTLSFHVCQSSPGMVRVYFITCCPKSLLCIPQFTLILGICNNS